LTIGGDTACCRIILGKRWGLEQTST